MLNRYRLKLKDSANDSESIIRNNALKNSVLALPGTSFVPDGSKIAYVRAPFSLLGPEVVEEALKRLRKVILEVRGEHKQNNDRHLPLVKPNLHSVLLHCSFQSFNPHVVCPQPSGR